MTGHIFPCPNVAKGQPCIPCEELVAINQEISEAESLLATLNAKRTLICGRMNRAHDSITLRFPAEIVSKIFTNFLPVDVDWDYGISANCPRPTQKVRTTPFLLGGVCKAWRTIALSTPELWTSIAVNLVNIDESHLNILRDWICRSGGLPLYVGIAGEGGLFGEIAREALKIFSLHSDRWFYLELRNPDSFHHYLRPNHLHALMLHTLKIETYTPIEAINLGIIPNLKHLQMNNLQVDKILNMDWEKLTNAEVGIPSINMCFDFFSKAAFLTHCTFYLHLNDKRITRMPQDAILPLVPHNHLVFLHIKNWTMATSIIFSVMEFPALQHLVVDSQTTPINLENIISLLRRSHCSLKTLEVDLSFKEMEFQLHLIPFLAEIPSLDNLKFRRTVEYRSVTGDDSVNPLLTWLSKTALAQQTATGQITFLPNLKNLYIENMELSYDHVVDVLKAHSDDPAVLTAAFHSSEEYEKSRHIRPLRSLDIRLDGHKYEQIGLDVAQQLQRAIEGGFDVAIVTDCYDHGLINILDNPLHPSET